MEHTVKNIDDSRIKKYGNFKSIRIKNDTKNLVDKKLGLINKSDEFGKINYDRLIQFLIDEITPDQIQALQKTTVTWKIEEPRLIKLWAKKNGKITGDKWKEMLYMGQLQGFIREHSRIAV